MLETNCVRGVKDGVGAQAGSPADGAQDKLYLTDPPLKGDTP